LKGTPNPTIFIENRQKKSKSADFLKPGPIGSAIGKNRLFYFTMLGQQPTYNAAM
jgi:hypothetical protein